MNDIQFAMLRHAAGDGPAVPRDTPDRDSLLIELGRAGLLRVRPMQQVFQDLDAPPSVLEHSITYAGRCAYETERDLRASRRFRVRFAKAVWEIARTAGALFLGMVIGHSEGCVFGEGKEPGRESEQRACCQPGQCGGEDAPLGPLEPPAQVDAGAGRGGEIGLERLDSGGFPSLEIANEVANLEVALPDIDGDEGGERGAALVE